jgi:glycosyltransferase involved in cell wall biosynthesis
MTSNEKITKPRKRDRKKTATGIRIVQICSADSIGGGERHLADLSGVLGKRGNKLFFALRPGSPILNDLTGVPAANVEFFLMSNAADLASAVRIGRFAKRVRADIIHAHLARDYPLAAVASRLSGVPFVLTRHVLFPMRSIHKRLLKHVAGVIAPSEAIFDALRKDGIFPLEKLRLIRHGVARGRYSGSPVRSNENFTVGTIGHLAPIKGHDIFIRAAKMVLEKRDDIRFVIVGEDKTADGKNRRELERLISGLGLQERVNLAGWTDKVPTALAGMDIFVSAARSEPFGLVMVEAMMAGLPVIASGSEGALEIIEDGKSGLLVPVGDHVELAATILALVGDDKQRNGLASAGRERARLYFSLDRMVDETESFYMDILRGRNAAGMARL